MQTLGTIYVSGPQKINIGPTEHGIEDYAVYQWMSGDEPTSRVLRSRIKYNEAGDAYFVSYGRRHYFKNAVRKF